MTIKRFISACTPSYFVDAVRARRLNTEAEAQKRAEAEKDARERAEREASSWEDARTRAGSYDDEVFAKFRIARSLGHNPDGSLLIKNPLGIVAQMIAKPDLSVTDFGGSTGELGRDLLLSYPGAHYRIVETPSMVSRSPATPQLTFSTTIPEHCDIFYCSGALQYLENSMDVLATGMRSAERAAILRRNYFSDEISFAIQKSRLFENGSGPIPEGYLDAAVSYPRRTLIEADVHALAKSLGFRCIASFEDDALPGGYSRQLVFWRA